MAKRWDTSGNALSTPRVLQEQYQHLIQGKWEFDYNQKGIDLDGQAIDYQEERKKLGETYTVFHPNNRFNGKIWGDTFLGSYTIKGDSLRLYYHTNDFSGGSSHKIIELDASTFVITDLFEDKVDTTRYIRVALEPK